jgi:hypothetical protein
MENKKPRCFLKKKKKNFDATTLGFWLIRNMRVAGA